MKLFKEDSKDMIGTYLASAVPDEPDQISKLINEKGIQFVLDAIRLKEKMDTDPGSISDGYHTFDELYHHRAILFSVVCKNYPELAWKSKLHHDPKNNPMYDGMFIVGIETPMGQATYHYYTDPYWDIFNVKELETAPEWDGHTPDEAIKRISSLE